MNRHPLSEMFPKVTGMKNVFQVHVVKDATRGATLEVVVSRMKTVQTYRTSQNPEAGLSMRFVAVSATIPNIYDVGTQEQEFIC